MPSNWWAPVNRMHQAVKERMEVMHVSWQQCESAVYEDVAGICVAGAALWDQCCSFAWQALGFGSMMAVLRGPAMQLTCNTHATHSQHDTQHEDFPCKFSIKMPVSRGWPRIRSLNANIWFLHTMRILIENLQEKCSCCVSCWLCVACVLHVSCMAEGHATHQFC